MTTSVSEKHVTKIGTPLVVQVNSPNGRLAVVFEDDGDTGYFYALAPVPDEGKLELLDALHIYNAEDNLRGADVRLEVLWSGDSTRAGLRVNASLWAMFDFGAEVGRSRSNFPPPAGRWRMDEARPDWDDSLLKLF